MKIKTLQIMLLIAAILCAVGIFASLGGGNHINEKNFKPPAWLKDLGGLSGGPRLTATDLSRNGVSLQEPLMLLSGTEMQFNVSNADDEVRRVAFLVSRQGSHWVNIRYQPNFGQRLNGKTVDPQQWPNEENGEPSFVVYDRGGTFTFHNAGTGSVQIRLED